MPLFSRDNDSKQPQGEDVVPADGPHAAAYESGSLEGIPASGRQRIARMKGDAARGFFTSDLSVNEFLLVKESGGYVTDLKGGQTMLQSGSVLATNSTLHAPLQALLGGV